MCDGRRTKTSGGWQKNTLESSRGGDGERKADFGEGTGRLPTYAHPPEALTGCQTRLGGNNCENPN